MTKKKMTKKEIMSYQGHEFTYVFEDGDTMPAYIKKIDLKKNLMSCWSLSLFTDQNYEFVPLNKEEQTEGACCLINPKDLDSIINFLVEIKTTGKVLTPDNLNGKFSGCPF